MYYRIVSEYLGDKTCFKPTNEYENVDIIDGKIVETSYGTKEVCFSKSILGCLFAISMFLKENEKYYIYATNVEPCIDLSKSSIGDFKSSEEVRYRKNVTANLVGTYYINDNFLFAITSLYTNCQYHSFFDNDYAIKTLNEHYRKVYEDIVYV